MKFALIVSGDALIQAMKEPLSSQMMEIANVCDAVICCRVAPKQKAEVVQLVRKTVRFFYSLFLTKNIETRRLYFGYWRWCQ